MAYAGFRFVKAIHQALQGAPGIIEECYVYLPGIRDGQSIANELGVEYCAVRIEFGKNGAERALPIGPLSVAEKELLATAVADLKTNISTGVSFIRKA